MAVIQNERDKILQAASVRFIAPEIDPGLIPGYEDALDDIAELQDAVSHALNSSKQFAIRASALTVRGASGTTTPASVTLTAVRGPDLVGGTVTWSVETGVATVSPTTGESTSVTGSSITGSTATIRARLVVDSKVYDAYVTLTKLGAISAVDRVNLTNQVTGSLASGNVSGLGALALLNVVDLNTQTVGALNGLTQVTNLGALAYANSIAANQIGAGTLAAGVIYAGNVAANKITAGTLASNVLYTGTLAANQITSGTLGASVVYAGNITADQIVSGTLKSSISLNGPFFHSGSTVCFLGYNGSNYGLSVDSAEVVRIQWPLAGTVGSKIVVAGNPRWLVCWMEDPVGGPARQVKIRVDDLVP